MLLMLLPEQVPQYWEDIKEGISRAAPMTAPDRHGRILVDLQTGRAQCWISYQKKEGEAVVDGAVITILTYDESFGARVLLIYAVWTLGKPHTSTWIEGVEALKKFARSKKCERIIAYSSDETIKSIPILTGGEAKYTFLSWDV